MSRECAGGDLHDEAFTSCWLDRLEEGRRHDHQACSCQVGGQQDPLLVAGEAGQGLEAIEQQAHCNQAAMVEPQIAAAAQSHQHPPQPATTTHAHICRHTVAATLGPASTAVGSAINALAAVCAGCLLTDQGLSPRRLPGAHPPACWPAAQHGTPLRLGHAHHIYKGNIKTWSTTVCLCQDNKPMAAALLSCGSCWACT